MKISNPLAQLIDATKFYNSRLIFKNAHLTLVAGELTLVIGENGAGKSTLLRILAGLASLESGKYQINQDLTIGYLGHGTFIYPELTAEENLLFWAKVFRAKPDLAQIERMLEKVGLVERKNEQTRFFSRGMVQRLNFARILLLRPKLLLLDEPFTGLDNNFRIKIRQEIIGLKEDGSAIALVSHSKNEDMEMAENICEIVNRKLVVKQITDEQFAREPANG